MILRHWLWFQRHKACPGAYHCRMVYVTWKGLTGCERAVPSPVKLNLCSGVIIHARISPQPIPRESESIIVTQITAKKREITRGSLDSSLFWGSWNTLAAQPPPTASSRWQIWNCWLSDHWDETLPVLGVESRSPGFLEFEIWIETLSKVHQVAWGCYGNIYERWRKCDTVMMSARCGKIRSG
jgi:hypothetical protein